MGQARLGDSYETGLGHLAGGRYSEAIICFETVLSNRPDDVRALFALGNTAEAIGHKDAAETFFLRVLAQEPDRLEALVNLANLLRARGKVTDCIALLKPAIERNPSQAELWMTLGSALRESGDAQTAEVFYREALRLRPDYALAAGNLADLLADAGQIDSAMSLYNGVIEKEPRNAQARLNRALLFFLRGELEPGWRDYEFRLKIKGREIVPDHGLKRWTGKFASTLKLLVTAEQGIGDQIMFASLLPQLAAEISRRQGTLFVETEQRLVPIFARSLPGVEVRPARIQERAGKKLSHNDWVKRGDANASIEIGSLPMLFRRDWESFPKPHAYLKPDADESERAAEHLRSRSADPFIGLCWRSGLRGGLRDLQFAPLEAWAEFIRGLRATVVSLQYDAQAEEIAALKAMSGRDILVPQCLDQKQEIDRTAAMIACLDGIVSAPTSVAWIAAAIGRPTFKVLYNTSWTSFGKDYEPFAPACRIVAPERSGDWSQCLAKALTMVSSQLRL